DAIYDESVVFDDPFRHNGVVLEAVAPSKPRIRNMEKRPRGSRHVIWIRGVPGVVLRGFHIVSAFGNPNVYVSDHSPGVVLDGVEMTALSDAIGVEMTRLKLMDGDEPVMIKNCKMVGLHHGIMLVGGEFPEGNTILVPTGRVIVRDNMFIRCGQTIHL